MDSWSYDCDPNKTFTMRVLECEDSSTPDEYLKIEKLDMDDNSEELDETFLLSQENAINMERRKSIEEKNRADGLSPFVKNEIIVNEIHEDEMSEDINQDIKINIDEELMKSENITNHFFIQDDEPQEVEKTVTDFGKRLQSRPPEDQDLTHKEKTLMESKLNANPENMYKCVDCKFDFKRKVSLRSYSYLNNKENAFKCSLCYKEPNNILAKDAIKRSRTRYSKNFECYQCAEIFLLKTSLDVHLLIHEKKTSFECLVCNRKFIRKWYLLTHTCKVLKSQKKVQDIRKSNTQPEFVNENVSKETTLQNFNLNARNSKSGNECGKNYCYKSDLNSHSLTHTGVKPLECHYCKKQFKRRDSLNQHLNVHTGKRPYECKHCNFKFKFSSNLRRHLVALHIGF